MSDFQGIGGVSATLQALIRDRIELPTGVTLANLQVTVANPKVELDAGVEPARVNLFLYRVTENAFLKNQEIPGRGHPGDFGRPPLSVNLHYLLTAYGTTQDAASVINEERSHELFGAAMRVLHDIPVVTDTLLRVRPPVGTPILHASLRDDFEAVKVTLEPATLEDISKVWTALTLPYRVSVSYVVSVVQIDSRRPRRLALPVKSRRVHVSTLMRPRIDAAYRTPVAAGDPVGDARVAVGQSLTLEGSGFRSPNTAVRLGDAAPVTVANPADGSLQVTIPNDPALRPGAQLLQVTVERDGEAVAGGLDHGTVIPATRQETSNASSFVLAPSITSSVPASGPAGTILTINGTRLFGAGIESFVVIGNATIPVTGPAGTTIQVTVPALAPSPTPYRFVVMANGVPSVEEGAFLVV